MRRASQVVTDNDRRLAATKARPIRSDFLLPLRCRPPAIRSWKIARSSRRHDEARGHQTEPHRPIFTSCRNLASTCGRGGFG
ncbi:MAG TPA: hypothetical protein DCQ98_04540 [Planctomycetaceae bacterium]|nr:hypothetical protein [Planctomycetaceae bacterium]